MRAVQVGAKRFAAAGSSHSFGGFPFAGARGSGVLPLAGYHRAPYSSSGSTPAVAAPRPFYLDYQATTPVDPRVLDAMLPFYVDMFGNPHSRTHAYGWEAEEFVEVARKQIADLIGVKSKEIIFTSGATESNNLAIKGAAHFYAPKKKHIITTQIEHKCVLASCRDLQEREGFDVTYLPVGTDGLISLQELEAAIRPDTGLVSIMMVNNEIGVIQPIEEIGALCKRRGVLFHTDGAQACGKIPIDAEKLHIDLMSISGHKIYGPKGIGALFVRSSKPRVRLAPVISGGGQERGMRSGTLPTPLVVGLGAACQVAKEGMSRDARYIQMLENRLYNGLKELPRVTVNGSMSQRYKGNLNMSFEAVEGESLLMSLNRIAVSSGSACTSASLEPSYVLRAIGVNEDLAHTSLRFGLGRFTTIEEVDECIKAVCANVARLREMSPLWEFVCGQEGATKPVWT